jgi:hypothetical protein
MGRKVDEMNAANRSNALGLRFYFGIVSAILFLSAVNIAWSAEEVAVATGEKDEIRVSRSLRLPERNPAGYSKLEKQSDSFKSFAKEGSRTSPSSKQFAGNDFWFYEADVILFNDNDGDGFFWGIDLLFDVDTYFDVAEIYAVAYLSLDGGPWNEYVVTESFPIFGAIGDDSQVVVTDLVSGYPTGRYDILIEVFDAIDGAFLASFGPEDTSELGFLPLEDSNRDDPHFDDSVVIVHGGGSISWWTISVMLLLLLGTSLRNGRIRRQKAPVRKNKFD